MRRFGVIFGGLALAAVVAGVGIAQAQGAFGDIISARQASMKQSGPNLGAVKKALDAGGDLTSFAANAQSVADWGHKIPAVFPAGSGPESGVKTNALPEIWANKADFDKLAGNLAAAAEKLVVALKANDKAAATAALSAVGGACGACHRTYRAKI